MTLPDSPWNRDLVLQKRALHSAVDAVARLDAPRAAELRLELYTLTYEFEAGRLGRDALDRRFRDIRLSIATALSHAA
jgi:hypothetical protein